MKSQTPSKGQLSFEIVYQCVPAALRKDFDQVVLKGVMQEYKTDAKSAQKNLVTQEAHPDTQKTQPETKKYAPRSVFIVKTELVGKCK